MLKKIEKHDITNIWNINQSFLPKVSSVNQGWFEDILKDTPYFYAYYQEDEILAFMLALPPGLAYESKNYQWFSNKFHNDFLYVDRLAVIEKAQGKGLGKLLYQELENLNQGQYSRIACEVNIKPLNQASLDFHKKIGFKEVGQQDTENQTKRVSLLTKELKV